MKSDLRKRVLLYIEFHGHVNTRMWACLCRWDLGAAGDDLVQEQTEPNRQHALQTEATGARERRSDALRDALQTAEPSRCCRIRIPVRSPVRNLHLHPAAATRSVCADVRCQRTV